jgi:hypothetical protein
MIFFLKLGVEQMNSFKKQFENVGDYTRTITFLGAVLFISRIERRLWELDKKLVRMLR